MKYVVIGMNAGSLLSLIGSAVQATPPDERRSQDRREPRAFRVPATWDYSAPLIAPEKRDRDPSRAQKDPTLVYYGGRWHVFMTVKLSGRSAIEYCSFERWENADRSPRTILEVSDSDYYCAPQVRGDHLVAGRRRGDNGAEGRVPWRSEGRNGGIGHARRPHAFWRNVGPVPSSWPRSSCAPGCSLSVVSVDLHRFLGVGQRPLDSPADRFTRVLERVLESRHGGFCLRSQLS